MVDLQYHLPMLGLIKGHLFNESENLYRVLLTTGEIDRLKDLEHLGAIRLAWEGARHSRWEYVVLILALIEKCREIPNIHISNRVILTTGSISSGFELLNCWSLLLNLGHLQFTFATERALLLEVWQDSGGARREFLSVFADDSELQEWARSVLKHTDVYQFYQALSFVRLRTLVKQFDTASWTQYWHILRAYVLADQDVQRLCWLFDRIRRVAYLILDSSYTPSSLGLNPTSLFSDKEALAKLLMDPLYGEEDVLLPVERYMYRSIYLASSVLEKIARREHSLRHHVQRSLRRHGFAETVEILARGRLEEKIEPKELESVVRLEVALEPPLDELLFGPPSNPSTNPRIIEGKLLRDLPAPFRDRYVPIVWRLPHSSEYVCQILGPASDTKRHLPALLMAYKELERIRRIMNKSLRDVSTREREFAMTALLLDKLSAELVMALLKEFFSASCRYEWHLDHDLPRAVFGPANVLSKLLKEYEEQVSTKVSLASELRAKAELLKNYENKLVIVSVRRLLVFVGDDKSHEHQVGDIDGLVFHGEVSPRGMRAHIKVVEIKGSYRKSQEAKRQLKNMLSALEPAPIWGSPTIGQRRLGARLQIAWADFQVECEQSDSCDTL